MKEIKKKNNLKFKNKNEWIEMYVLRFPSVTTWMQSSLRVVIGHLHSAPERLVPGCKFWSSGAPTSNLLLLFFFSTKKENKKEKKRQGKYIIQIWQEKRQSLQFLCTSVYIHPPNNNKKGHA
jgi:hypothetical protein